MNFQNINVKPKLFEKVQLIINNSWSNNTGYNCFITGLTPSGTPIIKKAVLLSEAIDESDKEKYMKKLLITKDEINDIKKNNAWILENKVYDEFYYDF